jgi:hypothetical protein
VDFSSTPIARMANLFHRSRDDRRSPPAPAPYPANRRPPRRMPVKCNFWKLQRARFVRRRTNTGSNAIPRFPSWRGWALERRDATDKHQEVQEYAHWHPSSAWKSRDCVAEESEPSGDRGSDRGSVCIFLHCPKNSRALGGIFSSSDGSNPDPRGFG